jgi:hypothetical protein
MQNSRDKYSIVVFSIEDDMLSLFHPSNAFVQKRGTIAP